MILSPERDRISLMMRDSCNIVPMMTSLTVNVDLDPIHSADSLWALTSVRSLHLIRHLARPILWAAITPRLIPVLGKTIFPGLIFLELGEIQGIPILSILFRCPHLEKLSLKDVSCVLQENSPVVNQVFSRSPHPLRYLSLDYEMASMTIGPPLLRAFDYAECTIQTLRVAVDRLGQLKNLFLQSLGQHLTTLEITWWTYNETIDTGRSHLFLAI